MADNTQTTGASVLSSNFGSQELQNKYLQGLIDNQGMGGLDYMNMAAGGIGSAINVASYFDNKAMMKTQMAGINDNIKGAREERAYRSKFRANTATAFA